MQCVSSPAGSARLPLRHSDSSQSADTVSSSGRLNLDDSDFRQQSALTSGLVAISAQTAVCVYQV